MRVTRSFMSKKLLGRSARCTAVLILCPLLYGQNNERARTQQRDSQGSRTSGLSDLAKDNLNRVAASSIQIKAVLVKDAGLLVELKLWVAREATDNGQVVEDSNLSDQAIFDCLERDVAFRSVATRLLQRYGYLMPSPNPDSSFAKEEDLVLKERARRLVQVEAQEDSESLHSERNDQDLERTAACDPRLDSECETSGAQNSTHHRRESENESSVPDTNPQYEPDTEPSISSPRTMKTALSTDGLGQGEQLSTATQIELASNAIKSRADTPLGSRGSTIPAPDDLTAAQNNRPYAGDVNSRDTTARNDILVASMRSNQRTRPTGHETERQEDVTPVKMVRAASPYADVPSLYDMYVQAAAWQRPAERFGSEIFRKTINQADVIPMDLPVGPDYVVGTGDSLSIDVWGSVTQRLVRLVDREGRIALPETGPVLVTGKSLGDVQLEIQRALRRRIPGCFRRRLHFPPANRTRLCGRRGRTTGCL